MSNCSAKIGDKFRISSRSAVNIQGKDVEAFIEYVILFVEQMMNRIKSLLISDSIVISLAFDNSGKESDRIADRKIEWMYFLTFVAFLLRKAFDAGLPLRGAIDTGPYLIHEYIFAGKPIIESYRLSAQLQFSGCALTNNAKKEIEKLCEDNDESNDTFFKPIFTYLAPLSDKDERLNLIDWVVGEDDLQEKDVRKSIIEAFHAHNKDIPRKVLPVIENTEMILRHIISRRRFSVPAKLNN